MSSYLPALGIAVVVTLAVGVAILLMVAVPGMRNDRQARFAAQAFRLPSAWTGTDGMAHGFFGDDGDTAHLPTREQARVTALREHSYVLRPQPRRHALPPVWSMRPRTRHRQIGMRAPSDDDS